MTQTGITEVKAFWDSNPCQSDLSEAQDRRRYFEEISRNRFGKREWHVPTVAAFHKFRGKDVLEVGCSIATDGLEFAKNGATYTGIDLTPNAIEMARERFQLFGAPGRFEVANAEERIPFRTRRSTMSTASASSITHLCRKRSPVKFIASCGRAGRAQ